VSAAAARALLASGSVQEAHDMAAVAHAATMRRGFRHCILRWLPHLAQSARIEVISDEVLRG